MLGGTTTVGEHGASDTKTSALTALMGVEVRDLMRCVLCDIGGSGG